MHAFRLVFDIRHGIRNARHDDKILCAVQQSKRGKMNLCPIKFCVCGRCCVALTGMHLFLSYMCRYILEHLLGDILRLWSLKLS